MLVELAIADSFSGELTNRPLAELVLAYEDLSFSPHLPKRYTGITQSNIAIAKMLILGLPWLKDFLANSLVTTFRQDPRVGYGEQLDQLLIKVRDGNELLDSLNCDHHLDNPAVRAVPIGILANPEQVIKASITQAAITNNTPDGWNAAIAVSLMSHYLIYRLGKKEQLKDFLTIYIDTQWLRSKTIAGSPTATVRQAIEAVIKHHSLSQLLQHCMTFSAQRPSVSAIALAAASCSEEYQQDLPQCLLNNLENNQMYGRDYLLDLDQKWCNLSRRSDNSKANS